MKQKKEESMEELIFQALGAASMCWSSTPSGVFDSTRCKQIGDELVAALKAAPAQATGAMAKLPNESDYMAWAAKHGVDTKSAAIIYDYFLCQHRQ